VGGLGGGREGEFFCTRDGGRGGDGGDGGHGGGGAGGCGGSSYGVLVLADGLEPSTPPERKTAYELALERQVVVEGTGDPGRGGRGGFSPGQPGRTGVDGASEAIRIDR